MSCMIELVDVSHRSGEQWRLHETSLCIPQGTITGVVGPNGSGKSTLLSLMSFELTPSSGKVLLQGKDSKHLSLLEQARLRAILTQDMQVSFPFTVREVVGWGRTPWVKTAQAALDEEVIREVIEAQELTEVTERSITNLSGGERKRVHIARILAQKAPMLMLDEADSDLDLVGRQHLDTLVLKHKEEGGTAIIVSHDISRLARICDQFIIMRGGRVQAEGTANEVLTEANLTRAFGTHVSVTKINDEPMQVHVP